MFASGHGGGGGFPGVALASGHWGSELNYARSHTGTDSMGTNHAGASFPQVRIAKKPNWPTNRLERPSLQHELLAFSGCAGLRLFAAFVKLDQAYPPLKSPAPRTQNSLRTIGWSEVSSVKVTIPSTRLLFLGRKNFVSIVCS